MIDKSLRIHFPMLKTRQEILAEIYQDSQLSTVFRSWETRHQEEFLDFCSGQRGCKLIFDSFFKEILHPENHRERLEWLLSLFLKQPVKILRTLSNEHRISSGTSLLRQKVV